MKQVELWDKTIGGVLDELARDIERRLTNQPEAEVTSQKIGEMVMDGL